MAPSAIEPETAPAVKSLTKVNGIDEEMDVINVPDLFSSLMATPARLNAAYDTVRPQADNWISDVIKADPKWAGLNVKVNLTLLSGMWGPDCSAFSLRMSVDWNSWIFLFDDQFDEGHLSMDLDAALNEIARTREIMEDTGPRYTPESNPIRYAFQTCWDRVKENPEGYFIGKPASENLKQRWKWSHELYFEGLVKQVKTNVEGRAFTRDVDEYIGTRRGTIGAYPAIVLTEWCDGVDLPKEVADHPSIFEIMTATVDHIILVNDILSYKKDLRLGVDHNLISLLRSQGFSTQEAMDKAGAMVSNCHRRWYKALAELPEYGEEKDGIVLRFLDSCRNVALGNLHWSFETGRYLGKEGAQVRETLKLYLPKDLLTLRGTEVED